MAGIIEPVGLGEPRPVDVSNLEAELSALWRTAAEGPTAEGVVTRACTLTLLIYVENDEAAYEVTNLVAEVTRQNPCRAIIMMLEPAAGSSGLEAWVSAHCHLPVAGEKQVCSEQITIRARGEAEQGLPSVVLPLTVSGLPIFLWWRANSFSPPAYFDDILRVTQHVIVDSARFSPGTTHLQESRRVASQGRRKDPVDGPELEPHHALAAAHSSRLRLPGKATLPGPPHPSAD